jgi:hypothetical protein
MAARLILSEAQPRLRIAPEDELDGPVAEITDAVE